MRLDGYAEAEVPDEGVSRVESEALGLDELLRNDIAAIGSVMFDGRVIVKST